jgi:capsular exopolysaccharide synthesis family protein
MTRASAEINLRYALRAIRRRLPLFLVCVLLVPAAALVVSLLQKKEYTATASLYFRNPQFDQMVFGSSLAQPPSDPSVDQATNIGLVSLPRVAALTASKLHLTEQEVQSQVAESNSGQSNLAIVRATAHTPAAAANLANTYAAQFIAFRRNADRTVILSAERPLERQISALPVAVRAGSLGQSLQNRLSELRVLASLQTGNAELVQPAEVPTHASAPKPARNGALGLFFGILLGIGLVLLAEALDRRLRDPTEVEQIFERPLLAALPESAALTNLDTDLESVPQAEAFRMLWANLRYFTLSRDIRSVLITSADRDEGKSTVSWGLAAAAASAGKRTLVIEADLRNPTLAGRFKLHAPIGLTNVLAGDLPLADAVMCYRFPRADDDPRAPRAMDVLFAGPRPPNPSDLLQSRLMSDLLTVATDQYDLVVVDTPPVAVVSDAIPLITIVDGVIVVSRLGMTLRDHAHRLRQQLDHLDSPTLGMVVNSIEEAQPYPYEYQYGEAYTPPRTSGGTRNWVRARGEQVPDSGAPSRSDNGVATGVGHARADRAEQGPAELSRRHRSPQVAQPASSAGPHSVAVDT